MILVRHISNLIEQKEEHPARYADWRTGLRVRDLAPAGFAAGVCLLNDKRLRLPEFDEEVADASVLVFVDTDQEPTTLLIIAIAVIAVAGLSAAAIALNQNPTSAFSSRKTKEGRGGFGFDGIGITTAPGTTIPVAYGEVLVGGHVLQAWREGGYGENDEKGGNNQKLFMLLSLGEGPIQAIGQYTTDQDGLTGEDCPEGMMLNGRFIGEFPGVKVSTRLGKEAQAVCLGFDEVVKAYDQDPYLLNSESDTWKWKTKNPVEGIDVNLGFLEGLGSSDATSGEEGELPADRKVTIRVEVYDETDTTLVAFFQDDFNGSSQRKPVYRMVEIHDLEPAHYMVRVRVVNYRIEETPDARRKRKVSILGVNERMYAGISYKWQALVAVEIPATDKLSGGIPVLLTMLKGRKVDVGTGTDTYSRNRAWIARDLATHWRYGAAAVVKDTTFDLTHLEDMADFCDEEIAVSTGSAEVEPRSLCDEWITEAARAGLMLQRIAQPARTVIIRNGNVIKTKVRKRGRIPRMMFGMGNVGGKITITETAVDDRPNIIRCEFRDATNLYQRRVEPASLPGISELSGDARPEDVSPLGITRLSEARRFAEFTLRVQQNIFRAIRIEEVGCDRIGCEPLDAIFAAQDNHDGQSSGRILAYDGASITLDREVTLVAGRMYRYREQDPVNDVLNHFDFKGDGSTSAELPFTPLAEGNAVGRIWMLTRRDLVEMWELITIDPHSDKKATLEAVEYIDDNYSDESGLGDTGLFPYDPDDLPFPASDVVAVESFLRHGVSLITVEWAASFDADRYAVFYRQRDTQSTWSRVGITRGTSATFQTGYGLGIWLEVAVMAISARGRRDLLENAPKDELQIMRDDEYDVLAVFPATPENFQLDLLSGWLATLSWDAVDGATSYEIRENVWASGKVLYSGTDTSVVLNYDKMVRALVLRAKRDNWYSTDRAILVTSVGGYYSEVSFGSFDNAAYNSFNERFEGVINNGQRIFYQGGTFNYGVLQTNPDVELEYLTPHKELGELDEYRWHASLDIRVQNWWEANTSRFLPTMPHVMPHGFINKHYIDWRVFLEFIIGTYDPVTDVPWEERSDLKVIDVTDALGKTPIVIFPARYVRIRVKARRATNSRVSNEAFRALITRVAGKFYRPD